MADIKTKDVVTGTVKTIDRSAVATDKMKSAYIRTRDGAEQSTAPSECSAEEYGSSRLENTAKAGTAEAAHQVKKGGKNGVRNVKRNVEKAKDNYHKVKDNIEKIKNLKKTNQPKKTANMAKKTGKGTIKTAQTAGKGTVKTAQKTVKTAKASGKVAVKTAKTTAKTVKATAKATQKAAQAAKAAVKATIAGIKITVKAIIAAVKAAIALVKAIVAAIAAGGWIAVVIILVICVVALILGSVFGIFFSGEASGAGQTMQTVVQEINTEYDNVLMEIRNGNTHDTLEMSGSRAVWKEVLAVYSAKVNTDPDNPQEVATVDDSKKQLLKNIFWEMNTVSHRTEKKTETEITETDDGHGSIVQTEKTVTKTYLYITVAHKSADEMAMQYGFNQEQKDYLTELLQPKNNSLWSGVLYGITASDGQIVNVALSQIGNVGGQPYWSWYGFGSRVEWCACFVSWCAEQCGYIDTGVIPKYAGCGNGAEWFKSRGQWIDGTAEPIAGMIIFFDWDSPEGSSGPQDGQPDHTGIVQKVENGIVYAVEGNTSDSVRIRQYAVGHNEILGYGIPAY